MIRGILDRYLGTLVKYEVKDNVIIEYYSSGKTEVVGLYGLNDMDIEEYIYMLDETINDNASEIKGYGYYSRKMDEAKSDKEFREYAREFFFHHLKKE